MSKRELTIKIDLGTAILMAVCIGLGVLGSSLVRVAGGLIGHMPHPTVQAVLPSPLGAAVELLCDFETETESSFWKLRGVTLTRVSDYATHGAWAAQLSYSANQQAPAAMIEDALEDHTVRSDWSGYSELSFDVYNPQTHQERLILQLKDANGQVSKQDLYLNPESSEHVHVALDDLKEQRRPVLYGRGENLK